MPDDFKFGEDQMFEPENVFEAARTIRPLLDELLGADAAAADVELANFLARATGGEKVDNLVLDFLRKDERTRAWTKEFLEIDESGQLRSYFPLTGRGAVSGALKYRCPENDYVWYRRDMGVQIPRCPTHDLALELSGVY